MLRFRRSSFNGVQDLFFIHGFRQLSLYSTEVNSNFVNYLVENLGLTRQQALSTSSKFTNDRKIRGTKEVSDFNLVKNTASVVTFLKQIGLQQSQIHESVEYFPQILMSNVEQTLKPKTDALRKLGFSDDVIAELICGIPSMFGFSLNATIIPTIEVLRVILCCEDDVISVVKKLRFFHEVPKYLVPNVALLRSYGVSLDSIRKNLIWNPSVFVRTTDSLKAAVTRVEEKLGIPPNSPMFVNGLRIATCMSDKTIESKLQVYKSFGWTDDVIATHILLNPLVLSKSPDVIHKKLDFLMNEMGYKPSYLVSLANLFTCSLEKRMLPRHKVLLVLKENGLIKVNSFSTVIGYNESKFLKKYVLPFKEVHEVYSKFTGISLKVLTQGLSKLNSSVL